MSDVVNQPLYDALPEIDVFFYSYVLIENAKGILNKLTSTMPRY